MWYQRESLALRKNILKVDFRIIIGDLSNYSSEIDLQAKGKSFVVSAIKKGLDVIGLVCDNPASIIPIQQEVTSKKYDLWVIPAQQIKTQEGLNILALNIKQAITTGEAIDVTLQNIKKQKGYAIVISPPKRFLNKLNKLFNDTNAVNPDAIEIYNSKSSGFADINTPYLKLINSGVDKANDLEDNNLFNLIPRAYLESKLLLPPNQGYDYQPEYLENAQ